MKLETARLIIREYTPDDFDALYEILSDSETMKYYPKPYDEKGVQRWINWCIESYAKNRFGLWALELKETGEFIGDCGISLQNIDGEQLPENPYIEDPCDVRCASFSPNGDVLGGNMYQSDIMEIIKFYSPQK